MPETRSKVALISGANKGIGLAAALALGKLGITVLMGSRDAAAGERAAASVRDQGCDALSAELDVTDSATIFELRNRISGEYGKLDILINNAAINLDGTPATPPSELSMDSLRQVFETNVFGVVAVTQAMLPLLRAAEAGRIVNVGSNLASLTLHSDPAHYANHHIALGYASSKTALNAVTVAFAKELRDTPIKINSAAPGLTRTDLSASCVVGQEPSLSAAIITGLATLGPDGPSGRYWNYGEGSHFQGYTNNMISIPW